MSISILISPSLFILVVITPSSSAFNAALASPAAASAINSTASSSMLTLYFPIPFSLSETALLSSTIISFLPSGLSSKIIDLEINAGFTSKYGFSVVAPISVRVASSTKGSR